MRPWALAAGIMVILAIVACTERDAAQPAPPEVRISFEPVTFDSWALKLASYPPDIVVVDLWATWCVSCLERFPHMVSMWEVYKDRGVRFVSLNLDDHTDAQALGDARVFLERFGARFENYFMDENLMKAFARLDLIGIPAVVIYDREGNEVARLTGDNPDRQFTEDDIEAAVIGLLRQN